MGKENSIKTGTIVKTPRSLSTNTSINIGNAPSLLPSSTYQFGVVTGVNTTTKEIVYNAIEDNMGNQKPGKAIPLYKNKIQLPTTGSIVPLLRGPSIAVSVLNGQYVKITYYLDPIGVWQTVDNNTIERSPGMSPLTNEVNVNKLNIKLSELGIVNNQPEEQLNRTPYTPIIAPNPTPNPSPSRSLYNNTTPAPSPSVIPIQTPNYTFRLRLSYDTWIAQIYNNGKLLEEKLYAYSTFTEQAVKDNLLFNARNVGFSDRQNFYPPNPNTPAF